MALQPSSAEVGPLADDGEPDPSFWAGRKVVVTGGLGFIGSAIAHRLAPLGAELILIDSLMSGTGGLPFNVEGLDGTGRVKINISDVRDAHSLRFLLAGSDVIFNLAAQTSHMDSMHDPFTDLEVNATAQLRLVEICRHVAPDAKIIYASTRQVYGRPQYLPVDERHPVQPPDVNGINKAAGERYHILYNDVYGLRSTVLRLTNTYGPRMRIADARQTFVGIWIRRILENQPFEVWGGEQRRDFTFVDDAVDAFLLAAERSETDGRILNIGGHDVVTLIELANALITANAGGRFEIKAFPEDRKRIDIGDIFSDDNAFRSVTGWRPRHSLAHGLAQTIAFFRQHYHRYC